MTHTVVKSNEIVCHVKHGEVTLYVFPGECGAYTLTTKEPLVVEFEDKVTTGILGGWARNHPLRALEGKRVLVTVTEIPE